MWAMSMITSAFRCGLHLKSELFMFIRPTSRLSSEHPDRKWVTVNRQGALTELLGNHMKLVVICPQTPTLPTEVHRRSKQKEVTHFCVVFRPMETSKLWWNQSAWWCHFIITKHTEITRNKDYIGWFLLLKKGWKCNWGIPFPGRTDLCVMCTE